MINLLNLSKFFSTLLIFFIFSYNLALATDPVDIWKKKEKKNIESSQTENNEQIESLILIDDSSENENLINEEEVDAENTIVGLFDPEKNDFNLYMWTESDGIEIKKILSRINKLNLSKFSENLLFQILFTNSYPPKKNLSAEEFLDMKINWLIKNKKIEELEDLLKTNKPVGQNSKVIQSLIEEYLSTADIKSACQQIKFIDKSVQDIFLEKFSIYCLIYEDRKGEAQLKLDLLKENGFKDRLKTK